MKKMKLYYSPTSPYARKVMICAHEIGLVDRIEVETTTVSPTVPNEEYARHNPLMKVPGLELPDGRTLVDSTVICEYLDALGGGHLFPSGDARWAALRLHAIAQGTLDAALLARYETSLRPEALRWPEWEAGQLAKVDHALGVLESEVATWADDFRIGQIAVCAALGYLDLRFAARAWRSQRPQLAKWFERTGQRSSIRLTAPR